MQITRAYNQHTGASLDHWTLRARYEREGSVAQYELIAILSNQ